MFDPRQKYDEEKKKKEKKSKTHRQIMKIMERIWYKTGKKVKWKKYIRIIIIIIIIIEKQNRYLTLQWHYETRK